MNPTLLAILAGVVLIYVLLRGHVYVTRKVWGSTFEEERAEAEGTGEWWRRYDDADDEGGSGEAGEREETDSSEEAEREEQSDGDR